MKECLSYSIGSRGTAGFPALLLCMISVCINASVAGSIQNDSATSIRDTVAYDFLFMGGKYQNQFTFMSRNFGQRIPFVTNDLTYYTNFNLWLSASAYHFFDEAIPFQSSVSIGYGGNISKKLDYNVSYSHFLIPASNRISELQSLGFVQTTIGLDWNYV
jgi:hypothetical protein